MKYYKHLQDPLENELERLSKAGWEILYEENIPVITKTSKSNSFEVDTYNTWNIIWCVTLIREA